MLFSFAYCAVHAFMQGWGATTCLNEASGAPPGFRTQKEQREMREALNRDRETNARARQVLH